MQRAIEVAAAEHDVPVVLWTVLDEAAWRAACAVLAATPVDAALTAPDPAGPAPVSAVPSDRVDVTVDVAPVLDRLLAALRAHATQVQAVSRWDGCPTAVARFALSNRVLLPVLGAETYQVATGGATAEPIRPSGRTALLSRAARFAWPAGVRVVAG
jgi:N-acetyl-1-D-myo-inositol-2-amino-2-deoxy-alpha-D-glucopyranoside deacetylase